jgi:hypothetical protein
LTFRFESDDFEPSFGLGEGLFPFSLSYVEIRAGDVLGLDEAFVFPPLRRTLAATMPGKP